MVKEEATEGLQQGAPAAGLVIPDGLGFKRSLLPPPPLLGTNHKPRLQPRQLRI